MNQLYKVIVTLVGFFSALSVHGQSAVITGEILGRPNQVLSFVYPEDPITGYVRVGQALTDKQGKFTFKFDLRENRPIQLTYNISTNAVQPEDLMYNLWIEPGKRLHIKVSSDSLITYSGDCKHENQLLKKLNLHSWAGTIAYDTTAFRFSSLQDRLDTIKDNRLIILEKQAEERRFAPAFKTFVMAEIHYDNIRKKMRYLTEYASAKNLDLLQFQLPPEFEAFLKAIPLFDESAFYSLKYRNGLREYFDIVATASLRENESYTLTYFRLVDAKFAYKSRTKEYLKAYTLKFSYNFEQDMDSLNTALASFRQEFPTSKSLAYFEKKSAEKTALLSSRRALPDIALIDTLGKRISLQDLSGKVLFIDFWGSWCKPCLEEMPYSIKMEKEYKDRVLFVYINNPTDTREKWVATIKKYGIEGLHLKADKAAQQQLYEYFVFTNYPFYAVLDKTGAPLHVEGGIRPSKNGKQVLETALK